MTCPVCKLAMIAVERDGIETDYCINCRGLWFDRGEIELLAEKQGASVEAIALASASPAASGGRRKCPRCGRAMEAVEAGGAARVTIDRCPEGEGLWFDHRELGMLIDGALAPDVKRPLVRFLSETFAAKGG